MMKQTTTYDIYSTVHLHSFPLFISCIGTALALCAIALLSKACAIIPMASCTSLCQTYRTCTVAESASDDCAGQIGGGEEDTI